MSRWIFGFIALSVFNLSRAQEAPNGAWIMAYVEAKQPIYTMVEVNGQYELADDAPTDSSFVYSTGLMLIDFDKPEPVSYSWEGEEKWRYKIEEENIFLYSDRDTLYGSYSQNEFKVSSTLDDRPTFYYFKPLGFKADYSDLKNSIWEVRKEENLFNKKRISFKSDDVSVAPEPSADSKEDYTFYGLKNLNTIEYELSYPMLEDTYSEFGMIYFFKEGKKKLRAVYYPVIDEAEPQRKELELRKIKN